MNARFITAEDVDRIQFPGMGELGMISKYSDQKDILFADLTFAPGDGFNFHYHPNQDEVLYLFEGQLEAWVLEEKRILKAGDSMSLPAGTIHSCFNVTGEKAKMFVLLTPIIASEELGFELIDVSGEAPWSDLR
jgi:quercetin dioxygenase-like cupin family protein